MLLLSYFDDVLSLQEKSSSEVIPNGSTIEVRRFVGAGVYDSNSFASLIWDYGGLNEEIIVFTSGDKEVQLNRKFTGDGIKRIAIVMTNGNISGIARLGAFAEYLMVN